MKILVDFITKQFGHIFLANLILKFYGWFKIPMIGFVRPRVMEFTDNRLVVRIPLRRRSKNHLGTMYFGALATGADLAGGVVALNVIFRQKTPIIFVFKELKAEFLKRVEGDALFICDDVQKVSDAVSAAANTTERVNVEFFVNVFVPSKLGDEPAAKFLLTLSLRQKKVI